MPGQRLDTLIFERGLVESRERAKTTIMSGVVFVDGRRVDKPGTAVKDDSEIEVRGALKYVSRGGLKLEKALDSFGISPENKVCMDCGASTGGFSDCMLQSGAAKVYAVDVGYGQLAWKIRNDPRVVTLERTNVRYLTREEIPEEIDFAVVDVSFISLALVLPVIYALTSEAGEAVCLIKPQFEAGREKVGKKGVVRDPATHLEVLDRFMAFTEDIGFVVSAIEFSPIKGPEGNIEFLGHIRKTGEKRGIDTKRIVADAQSELG